MRFHETLVGPRWLATAGALTLAFVAVLAVIALPVMIALIDRVGIGTLVVCGVGLVAIVGAGAMGLARRIIVIVDDTHVDVRLVPFRVMHLPRERVTEVRVCEVHPAMAGGIGWRIVGRRRIALWSAGPAVRLTLEDGSLRILQTSRAEELRSAISAGHVGEDGLGRALT